MNLHSIPESDIQFSINDQLFLDTLLMEIRGDNTLLITQKEPKRQQETQLAAIILKLEQNLKEDNLQDLGKLKLELTELRQRKVKGAVIRSRATS